MKPLDLNLFKASSDRLFEYNATPKMICGGHVQFCLFAADSERPMLFIYTPFVSSERLIPETCYRQSENIVWIDTPLSMTATKITFVSNSEADVAVKALLAIGVTERKSFNEPRFSELTSHHDIDKFEVQYAAEYDNQTVIFAANENIGTGIVAYEGFEHCFALNHTGLQLEKVDSIASLQVHATGLSEVTAYMRLNFNAYHYTQCREFWMKHNYPMHEPIYVTS
ncbi:hypothetical protein AB4254_13590 [Vibrio breoganii]